MQKTFFIALTALTPFSGFAAGFSFARTLLPTVRTFVRAEKQMDFQVGLVKVNYDFGDFGQREELGTCVVGDARLNELPIDFAQRLATVYHPNAECPRAATLEETFRSKLRLAYKECLPDAWLRDGKMHPSIVALFSFGHRNLFTFWDGLSDETWEIKLPVMIGGQIMNDGIIFPQFYDLRQQRRVIEERLLYGGIDVALVIPEYGIAGSGHVSKDDRS